MEIECETFFWNQRLGRFEIGGFMCVHHQTMYIYIFYLAVMKTHDI